MRGAICKRFSANAPPGALRIFVLISVVLRGRVLVFGARERSERVTRRLSRLVSVAAVLVSRLSLIFMDSFLFVLPINI